MDNAANVTAIEVVPAYNAAEMVKITQLPIIEDRLRELRSWVEKEVAGVDLMECNEDTLTEVKASRAMMRKLFEELEEQRKSVLGYVSAPIERFKATYKECVSDYFKTADAKYKAKIDAVEDSMKAACEQRLREYFDELVQAHHLDFLKYEQAGIMVSMADARAKTQPPKKLREQLEQFFLRVAQDVETIVMLPDADEVAAIYMQTLNLTQAVATVNERHRQIEQAKANQERRASAKEQEAEVVRKVEAFAPPVTSPAPAQVEKFTCTFTVNDTKDRLRLLKQFLDANGYQYT